MAAVGTATEAPPRPGGGPIAWLRENLFSSWTNAALTLLALWLIYEAVAAVFEWAVLHATWQGRDGSDCTHAEAGACWPFVNAWFGQFLYGRYPEPERWRVNLTYLLAVAGLVPLMVPRVPHKLWSSVYLLAVFPVLAVILLSGGIFGLRPIPTDLWGGLLVTLVISSASPRPSPSASSWRWGGARPCRSCAGPRSASSSSCAACR
jgi:general L-amino acid transport system permease protein